jgi:hypothetical protein
MTCRRRFKSCGLIRQSSHTHQDQHGFMCIQGIFKQNGQLQDHHWKVSQIFRKWEKISWRKGPQQAVCQDIVKNYRQNFKHLLFHTPGHSKLTTDPTNALCKNSHVHSNTGEFGAVVTWCHQHCMPLWYTNGLEHHSPLWNQAGHRAKPLFCHQLL